MSLMCRTKSKKEGREVKEQVRDGMIGAGEEEGNKQASRQANSGGVC